MRWCLLSLGWVRVGLAVYANVRWDRMAHIIEWLGELQTVRVVPFSSVMTLGEGIGGGVPLAALLPTFLQSEFHLHRLFHAWLRL